MDQAEDKASATSGIIKLLVGLGVGAFIIMKTPIMEILNLFLYIVLIPIALLGAIGLTGSGALDVARSGGTKEFLGDARERINRHRREMAEEEEA